MESGTIIALFFDCASLIFSVSHFLMGCQCILEAKGIFMCLRAQMFIMSPAMHVIFWDAMQGNTLLFMWSHARLLKYVWAVIQPCKGNLGMTSKIVSKHMYIYY